MKNMVKKQEDNMPDAQASGNTEEVYRIYAEQFGEKRQQPMSIFPLQDTYVPSVQRGGE